MSESETALEIPAYAKVNFTLDVLSVRPDGYHNVATVMQTISQSDRVVLNTHEGIGVTLECDDPTIPRGRENLAVRAAEALIDAAGRPAGIHIKLEKRIPSKAGLGGGSSDAAATLRGVNHLLKLGFDSRALAEIGAGLGSDVPFFLTGGTAACRGRGEVVTPLDDAPTLWFVVVKPEVDVPTAEAYRAMDAIPQRPSARATRSMESILAGGDAERIMSRMTNDFEQAIFLEHLPLALLHDELMMARSHNARLCGSGSALFGVLPTRGAAEEAARLMRLKHRQVAVARSVSRAESLSFGEPVI